MTQMKQICIDSGVLGIFFSSNPSEKVKNLMQMILNHEIVAFLPKPVMIEAFFNICKIRGKEIARITTTNFLQKYPVKLVEFDNSLLTSAGQLKCQHRSSLSYIDCMGIALAMTNKIEFHTTEKNLKKIPNNVLSKLKITTYRFL